MKICTRLFFALLLLSTFCLAQTPPAGWAVISVNEYEALRTKASPTAPTPAIIPVDATLTRLEYELSVDGAVASGQANLTVDVLKPGWVALPIPQGLLIRDARIAGQRVSLVPVSKPGLPRQLSALLAQPGRATIQLTVAFPVVSTGAEERLALPPGRSGVTRATIQLPGRDLQVTVAGGHLAEESPNRWLAFAKGTEPLTFNWRKRTEEKRETVTTRMRATLTQLFGLGEDAATLSAEVEVEVIQGAAQQIQIAVPANVTINQVPGANVGDWKVANGTLDVMFLEPVDKSTKFVISGELQLPGKGTLPIPLLRVLDVERETGGVAVEILGAGEIKDSRARGLEPTEASSLGSTIAARQSPSLAAFRLRPVTAPSLELDVARYDQATLLTAIVEEARYRVLLTADGKTLVQARYAVRNNQRNFLSVRLPAGASLWSASLAGQPVRPGKTSDGTLLIPLAKGRAGDDAPPFGIELMYSVGGTPWTPQGIATLALPVLDLPASRSGLVLYVPPLYRVTTQPGTFRVQPYENPSSSVLNAPPVLSRSQPALNASVDAIEAMPSTTQSLVDRYRTENVSRRTAERLPVRVTFPTLGPSGFLASELTPENAATTIQFKYQQNKVGGVQ